MEVEIQPTARELLAIIGLLWMENDSLRQQVGGSNYGLHFCKRTFTNEDVVRGARYCPKAVVKTSGSIIVSLES